MAIGRTGSFATTQAPTDNILQSMQYVDQLDYRAKQDEANAAAAKAKAEEVKDLEFKGDLDKAKAVLTGKRGYDAPVIDAVNLLTNGLANSYRDYKSGKLSKSEYDIKKNNILSQVDLMGQKSKFIIGQQGTLTKMIEDGKVADGFEDRGIQFSKSIENGSIIPELDENGNLTFTAWETDENNIPTKIIEKSTISDFGNSSLTPVGNIDFQKELELFKKNNPLGLVESLNGQIKTGKKELSPNTDNNIKAYASSRVKDKDALSVAYRNATGNIETNITDTDKIKKAEDWIYQNFKDSYTKEIFKDEATQRASLAEQKRKNKEEEAEKKASFGQVEVPTSITGAGYQPKEGYKAVSVRNGRPFNILAGQTFATVNSYTVTTDGTGKERVVAEIVYPDVKTSSLTPQEKDAFAKYEKNPESLTESEKLVVSRVTTGAVNKTKIVTLDEADSDKLAGQMRLNSSKEVRDAAKYKDVNEKSERETWDDAYNKGQKKYDEYGVEIK